MGRPSQCNCKCSFTTTTTTFTTITTTTGTTTTGTTTTGTTTTTTGTTTTTTTCLDNGTTDCTFKYIPDQEDCVGSGTWMPSGDNLTDCTVNTGCGCGDITQGYLDELYDNLRDYFDPDVPGSGSELFLVRTCCDCSIISSGLLLKCEECDPEQYDGEDPWVSESGCLNCRCFDQSEFVPYYMTGNPDGDTDENGFLYDPSKTLSSGDIDIISTSSVFIPFPDDANCPPTSYPDDAITYQAAAIKFFSTSCSGLHPDAPPYVIDFQISGLVESQNKPYDRGIVEFGWINKTYRDEVLIPFGISGVREGILDIEGGSFSNPNLNKVTIDQSNRIEGYNFLCDCNNGVIHSRKFSWTAPRSSPNQVLWNEECEGIISIEDFGCWYCMAKVNMEDNLYHDASGHHFDFSTNGPDPSWQNVYPDNPCGPEIEVPPESGTLNNSCYPNCVECDWSINSGSPLDEEYFHTLPYNSGDKDAIPGPPAPSGSCTFSYKIGDRMSFWGPLSDEPTHAHFTFVTFLPESGSIPNREDCGDCWEKSAILLGADNLSWFNPFVYFHKYFFISKIPNEDDDWVKKPRGYKIGPSRSGIFPVPSWQVVGDVRLGEHKGPFFASVTPDEFGFDFNSDPLFDGTPACEPTNCPEVPGDMIVTTYAFPCTDTNATIVRDLANALEAIQTEDVNFLEVIGCISKMDGANPVVEQVVRTDQIDVNTCTCAYYGQYHFVAEEGPYDICSNLGTGLYALPADYHAHLMWLPYEANDRMFNGAEQGCKCIDYEIDVPVTGVLLLTNEATWGCFDIISEGWDTKCDCGCSNTSFCGGGYVSLSGYFPAALLEEEFEITDPVEYCYPDVLSDACQMSRQVQSWPL